MNVSSNSRFIQLCDFEFWVRVGINTGLTYVPETLAYFRVHDNCTSLSNANDRAYSKDVIDSLLAEM